MRLSATLAALMGVLIAAVPAVPSAFAADGASQGKQRSSARRGGYSYSQEDTINTYGDSRSRYGSASAYRDPALDKQTDAGPFDHGFFFDSATGARGGDAPYQN